jgi:2'-5' RNA ligase
MKGTGKYFIGLLLPPAFESQINMLKQGIAAQFQVKFALLSPAHLTLKMPFRYKEAKERELGLRLTTLLETQAPFQLQLAGIGHFGRRNIHQQVAPSESLVQLQTMLRSFCKRSLHLVEELSDRNFQPHVTLAYKDLKPTHFEEVLAFARENAGHGVFLVEQAYLLKKVEGRWKAVAPLIFGGNSEIVQSIATKESS